MPTAEKVEVKKSKDSQDIDPLEGTLEKSMRRRSTKRLPEDEFEQKYLKFKDNLEFDFINYRGRKRSNYLKQKGVDDNNIDWDVEVPYSEYLREEGVEDSRT